MLRKLLNICVLVLILYAAPSAAAEYSEGSVVAPFSIEDQFGQTHEIDGSVRAVLLGRDMGAGDVLQSALAESGAALLVRTGTAYLADVSRMPSLIRSWIAEPKMRRRGYPMLLDRSGLLTKELPSEKGKATLILLDQLRIVKIRHFESAEELRSALDQLPPGSVGKATP
jgi:hypothetical protein